MKNELNAIRNPGSDRSLERAAAGVVVATRLRAGFLTNEHELPPARRLPSDTGTHEVGHWIG